MKPQSLTVETLTREVFAPFGDVVETEGARHFPINDGTCERYHALAAIDAAAAGGRAIVSIFEGQPFAPPIAVTMMERHPLASQLFMPLSGVPYLVAVAEDDGSGHPGTPRVFLANAAQGVNYGRGVWHHPLLALERVSRFLIVDREGGGRNLEEKPYLEPGFVIAELPSLMV